MLEGRRIAFLFNRGGGKKKEEVVCDCRDLRTKRENTELPTRGEASLGEEEKKKGEGPLSRRKKALATFLSEDNRYKGILSLSGRKR